MAGTFHLQIVTPEREVYSGEVEQVTLPGAEGGFGVMRSHAPLIAALAPGVVDVYDETNHEVRIVIGGGFFQVAKNRAIVLADSAEKPNEIDPVRAQAAQDRAASRLAGQLDTGMEFQRERAAASLKRAQIRLKNATGRGPGQG